MTISITKPRRGRPPKNQSGNRDTRAELIRSGLEQLTESGFSASGIDPILKKVGVPKGSFYHYFNSKEAFGLAVIDSYANYFSHKLDTHLLDDSYPALTRIANFVADAKSGLAHHQFKRGCLIGNLGQEVDLLPESFRPILSDVFIAWQNRIAACLELAKANHDLSQSADTQKLAEYFWIGWEGAVSRTRLTQDTTPIDNYFYHFMAGLPR
ncbi:TetR/AcrR family transcriptional regulator [Psychromonas arctica]|uniref:acrylate utilization transcriptional regulator AcuR n=1 Tax=Psychromonas arctica TaxID=168275 RepID=UPI002FCF76E5